MKNLFSEKSFKVLLGAVSVLLVLVIVTAGNSSFGTYLVNLFTLPMQKAAVNAVDSTSDTQKSAEELQEEVNSLEEENRKLRNMLIEYYDIKGQNEQLKKYYNLKEENPDYDILPATVIRRDPNENFYGFYIDKGTVDGVEIHDPVVTEKGLVGMVCEVDATSCKVKTILSPDMQVGVLDSKTSDSGIVTGSSRYSDDNLTVMTKIPAQHTMQEGDIIVTSGLGGIFPNKIPIGEIQEIRLDEYDSQPMAIIKPYENIKEVTSVAVITDYLEKGTITKSEPKQENSSESPIDSKPENSAESNMESSLENSDENSEQSTAETASNITE